MTPLPKKRRSTLRQGRLRATKKMSLPDLTECSNCHKPIRKHRACPYCHFYKGAKIS